MLGGMGHAQNAALAGARQLPHRWTTGRLTSTRFDSARDCPRADLLLITTSHSDHLSPDDIAKIRTPTTRVVGASRRGGHASPALRRLPWAEVKTLAGVQVRACLRITSTSSFTPRQLVKLGYLVTIGGATYYHAGDTDLIPEMAGLAPDVALLPVSGTYVMTAGRGGGRRPEDPATSGKLPMHYGAIIGSVADAQRFAALLAGSGIEVVIMERE